MSPNNLIQNSLIKLIQIKIVIDYEISNKLYQDNLNEKQIEIIEKINRKDLGL